MRSESMSAPPPGNPGERAQEFLYPLAEGLSGEIPDALADRLYDFAEEGGKADDFRTLIDEIIAGGHVTPFVRMSLESVWGMMLAAEGRKP